MNDQKLLKILLFVYLLCVLLDIIYTYKKCIYKNGLKILPAIFLHRLISIFIYFGWLSNHKKILIFHIFVTIIAVLLQLNNQMRCPSTDKVNNNCNINRVNYLRDFLYFTNIKKNNLYYIYVFFSFIISCVKLYKSSN